MVTALRWPARRSSGLAGALSIKIRSYVGLDDRRAVAAAAVWRSRGPNADGNHSDQFELRTLPSHPVAVSLLIMLSSVLLGRAVLV